MLGLFSRKKKTEDVIHFQAFSGHVDSYKCLYLAAEKGLNMETVWYDPSEQAQVIADARFGKVPILKEGDQQFSGANAILPYLDVRGGGQLLTPKKAARLGEQNYWIQVGQEQMLPRLAALLDASSNDEQRDKSMTELFGVMQAVNDYLDQRNYFAGNFSFAEVHWMPYVHFCSLIDHDALIAPCQNVEKWFAHNKSRKNARQVMAADVLPTAEQLPPNGKRHAA